MKSVKNEAMAISMLILASCGIIFFVDKVIMPVYLVKSIFKVITFIGIPAVYSVVTGKNLFKGLFSGKSGIIRPAALGIAIYILMIITFYLVAGFIDLENIRQRLSSNLDVERDNFIIVALYISIINSLIEEIFFRGIAFIRMKEVSGRAYSYVLSAGSFAAYHVAILEGWADMLIVILAIVGLFVSGLFFNYIDGYSQDIKFSYLVHMFANFAINTIGLHMYGFIDLPFL
ncbi:CPBP family intramembrane glutamic endopeptidase [Youngiibacter multivorans]|uniref:Membrane protease YdiL (CAAX protease family) n=1 Tax=Youngiibacter multivorans TaxID=937251 RepID=A0ABS4FZ29_9CLOT|nr:membrane protease YdiL (CAAX protease family) [Youngiibacter multivorans]